MESLMYYVWQQRLFGTLRASDGSEIEVVNPGLRNLETGPDFFNAKVRIGGTLWAGNVEMHVKASDWYRHHHDRDAAYDSVILHVVLEDDAPVMDSRQQQLRTVVMTIPQPIIDKYRELTSGGGSLETISCGRDLLSLPAVVLRDWETSLAVQRMLDKVKRVRDLIEDRLESWPEAFWVILCRSFGTGTNSDACERLARSLPYSHIAHHLDNPLQVEALLLGQGGWLNAPAPADSLTAAGSDYYRQLQQEYAFLKAKFSLTPLSALAWKFSLTRPQANPQSRMAMLAALLCQHPRLLNEVIEAPDVNALLDLFKVAPSPYWRKHFQLEPVNPASETRAGLPSGLGIATRQSLAINAAVPIILAYGQWKGNEEMVERAMMMLENLPAENNRYVEYWRQAGLTVNNALESQSLLHLYKNYCQFRKCMRCRIGCWLLKRIRL